MSIVEVIARVALVLIVVAIFVKLAVVLLVAARLRRATEIGRNNSLPRPPVSVIVPVFALSTVEERTVLTVLEIDYPEFEVIYCLYDGNDPAFAALRNAIDKTCGVEARILVGRDETTRNPKLDNIAKAWRAAKHDLIAIVDASVDAPKDLIDRLIEFWDETTGAASSPPIGVEAENFWSLVECAFLNTSQACWLLAADRGGLGYAHGKVMMVSRARLDSIGGFGLMSNDTAEDSAVTKAVRRSGYRVRLVGEPVRQPLGRRDFGEVWKRQMRWAQLRFESYPAIYLIEPLSTIFAPLTLALVLGMTGVIDERIVLGAALSITVFWYATESALSRRASWPHGANYFVAAVIRDVLTLALWPIALFAGHYVWRGHFVDLKSEG